MLFDSDQPAPQESTAATAAPAADNAATTSTAIDSTSEAIGTELIEQLTDPDEIEDEIEGVKLRGKKDLVERIKSERSMDADYRRKTQALAEERRSWEAEREQHQQNAKLAESLEQDKFKLFMVDNRLQQLSQLNFAQIRAQNPEWAEQLRDEFQKLTALRPVLQGAYTQKLDQQRLATQRESAKRANDAEAIVASVFKDWSPTRLQALQEYARAEGTTPEQLLKVLVEAPHFARTINKALMWDDLQKQRAAKKPPPPPPPPARVTGQQATNSKSPSEMSQREYEAWRRKRKGM